MKIHGRKISEPNVEEVFLPRNNETGGILFRIQAVTDMKPFYALCPQPQAPKIKLPGGNIKEDVEDKHYQQELDIWARRKMAWMQVTSLRTTEGLEWETVDYANAETWENWRSEFEQSGLTETEMIRIMNAVMNVNGLSEAKVDEARQRFLAFQAARQKEQGSQTAEPNSTQSGPPANDSESSRQDLPQTNLSGAT